MFGRSTAHTASQATVFPSLTTGRNRAATSPLGWPPRSISWISIGLGSWPLKTRILSVLPTATVGKPLGKAGKSKASSVQQALPLREG